MRRPAVTPATKRSAVEVVRSTAAHALRMIADGLDGKGGK